MKTVVAGAAALVLGLAIAAPFMIVLIVMIAPLVVLAIASGWGSFHGGNRRAGSRDSAIDSRHVATSGPPH